MGSNSESDSSTTSEIFKSYILFETVFLFGRTWIDVFILTVICRDWMKKKRLSTTDKILTLQSVFRICLGCTMLIWFILHKFCQRIVQIDYVSKIIMVFFWYFVSCNVWLTASLSSYYCVKIADFSHPFFIHLKLRLPRLEFAWLLGSAVLALASSLPFANIDVKTRGNRNISDFFQNKTVSDVSSPELEFHVHASLGVGYIAAFSICASSAVLLLFSLWRHHQRMQGSWGGHRSPQTKAHLQAVATILLLLVNSVVAFVCIQLSLSRVLEENIIFSIAASVILYSCLSVESVVSIWSNKKFKNVLLRALHFAKCRGCIG